MAVSNDQIVAIFEDLADLLEIEGANPFRVRAYRNAARVFSGYPEPLATALKRGVDLTELPGIGEDLAGKVAEIVKTSRLSVLEDEKKKIPVGLLDLLKFPGLGPKRVRALRDKFRIKSEADLAKITQAGRLRELPGFGAKIEQSILKELEKHKEPQAATHRILLAQAEQIAQPLITFLQSIKGVTQVTIAGSYRRRLETVGDLDILVTCGNNSPVMDQFVGYEGVQEILSKGETRSTIRLGSGLTVDLRVVPEASYGSALLYFTGSKAHNIATRLIGVQKGFKINEYGIYKGTRRIGGKTEAEIYRKIGLDFIEPELREDRGEITAAQEHSLPKLLSLSQIRGDFHAHTIETDGRMSIEAMVEAAQKKGYEYLTITDHTKHLTVARGMDAQRLAAQIKQIDKLNAKLNGFRILKGAEIDILEDGSLDLPDSILKELDIRVCSIHYKFNLSKERQTERIIRAMDNPYFNILAHPTGRLLQRRPPYEVDLEPIMKAAKERNCLLEINSQPDRLDLSDVYCRMAKDMGLLVVISTDAHSSMELDFMRFGVSQARRGWLEAKDVLNTRSWNACERLLKRK